MDWRPEKIVRIGQFKQEDTPFSKEMMGFDLGKISVGKISLEGFRGEKSTFFIQVILLLIS